MDTSTPSVSVVVRSKPKEALDANLDLKLGDLGVTGTSPSVVVFSTPKEALVDNLDFDLAFRSVMDQALESDDLECDRTPSNNLVGDSRPLSRPTGEPPAPAPPSKDSNAGLTGDGDGEAVGILLTVDVLPLASGIAMSAIVLPFERRK